MTTPPPSIWRPATSRRWKKGLRYLAVVVVIAAGVFAARSIWTSRDIDTAKPGDCVEPDSPHNMAASTWSITGCTGSGDYMVIGRIDNQAKPADYATMKQMCRGFSELSFGIWVAPSARPGFVLCAELTGK